jgi:hypothetical protein
MYLIGALLNRTWHEAFTRLAALLVVCNLLVPAATVRYASIGVPGSPICTADGLVEAPTRRGEPADDGTGLPHCQVCTLACGALLLSGMIPTWPIMPAAHISAARLSLDLAIPPPTRPPGSSAARSPPDSI